MDFAETIEFLKKFPTCRPKVYKGFMEWGIYDTETDGYVVLADSDSAKKTCFDEMEEYAKTHKLRIDYGKDYLMICTHG